MRPARQSGFGHSSPGPEQSLCGHGMSGCSSQIPPSAQMQSRFIVTVRIVDSGGSSGAQFGMPAALDARTGTPRQSDSANCRSLASNCNRSPADKRRSASQDVEASMKDESRVRVHFETGGAR
jgi:hypothetical protein